MKELTVRFGNVGITACMIWKMEMVLQVTISFSETMKGCDAKGRQRDDTQNRKCVNFGSVSSGVLEEKIQMIDGRELPTIEENIICFKAA